MTQGCRYHRKPAGHILACVLGLALSVLHTSAALADDKDTISIVPGLTVMHDDNLFRLSSNADPQAVLGTSTKAEDITISSVTLKINKPYLLQRFELEASLIDYRYKNFSYLSYTAYPYKAAWRWSLTPNLHGNLSTGRSTSLNSFTDYTGYTRRNTHTDENTRFDGVFDLSAAWHLLGGVSEATTTNSEITRGEGDNRVKRAEIGVRHTFASGSTMSFITRAGKGDYLNRPEPNPFSILDNRFNDTENEVRLAWPLTGKTSLDARLAHLERHHTHYSERDFSGITGNLNLNWNITAKTSLAASVARELSAYQTLDSNYTQTDRISLMPYWQIGAKTALRAKYDYARRDYQGGPLTAIIPASNRRDNLHTAMIALEWQPYRSVSVSASLQNEKRTSSQPGQDYKDNTISLSAQAAF